MRIYMVGGAVRDALLGLPVQDRDWVVVGATPQWMLEQGFTAVGKDFPVFLHPQTHEEYALARTERKSGVGYKGFTVYAAPHVTLEQDLARRDLTINAIAQRQGADGATEYIDPFGGRADLAGKVLRHVSDAFAEDPLRILRLARFAARFADFAIASETMQLMRHMVDAGEVAHLTAERVWQEIARGLMEPAPQRMLHTLRACGALAVALPELEALWQRAAPPGHGDHAGEHALAMLALACQERAPLAVRYACLAHALSSAERDALAQRMKIPADVRDLADLAARECAAFNAWSDVNALAASAAPMASKDACVQAAQTSPTQTDPAQTIVQLLERCDAFRRPQRLALALQVCAYAHGQPAPDWLARRVLLGAWQQAKQVDTAAIAQQAARQGLRGEAIGQCIHQARVDAVRRAAERLADHTPQEHTP
ncbi:multifunctional CCA tRNA nucleotidyl transferase/2'3'-cyclic phosphodiesterase/2'nucleotidase/phosphatase [Comamonadaceae bacterium OH3737_COT-264]|nr:multifunctional CCA tRNA nucleotidyl transferase/2'3'-cyclic phosphodiesterase/2'nucleotidase/phosphatase [Comamonadaceae bacterium OH3737_COT-264]